MTLEDLANHAREAGHFVQVRSWGHWHGVELACGGNEFGQGYAPLIKVIRDDQGRWLLTALGEVFYQVPNENDVLAAAVEQIRPDNDCMGFSEAAVRKFNLIEIKAEELRAQR